MKSPKHIFEGDVTISPNVFTLFRLGAYAQLATNIWHRFHNGICQGGKGF